MHHCRIDLSMTGLKASRELTTLRARRIVPAGVHSASGGHEPAGRLHCARASTAAVWTDQCRQAGGIRLQDYNFTANPCRLDHEQSRHNSIICLGAICITPPARLRQLGKVQGCPTNCCCSAQLSHHVNADCQSGIPLTCNEKLYAATATIGLKIQVRQDQQDIQAQLPADHCKHKPAAC